MFKLIFLRVQYRVLGIVLPCVMSIPTLAQSQDLWTLEIATQRVLEIAPESKSSQSEIRARQGALQQAGAWPNPKIELRADDKVGKDTGTGGTDLTVLTLSQSIPVSGRLGYQKAVASAELNAARSTKRYQQLILENQSAQRFHTLQLAVARLRLAEKRLQLADELQKAGQRRAKAGDIPKLERLRLDLIREAAQQILDKYEGKYNEALSQFRAYLELPITIIPELSSLEPFEPVPELENLLAGLPRHPALVAAKYRMEGARQEVHLISAGRLPDPELRLFYEQDFLNGRRQDVMGVGIGISIPLWDRKKGRLQEVRAQMDQSLWKFKALERDLGSRLKQSYLHLSHLVQQGEHYRTRVYEPAGMVFDLTRKAYVSGEVEILSLIDANNTYFDANERYLELLQEAWLEAADLRLAAGRILVTTEQDTDHE
ncbi:MAG: TolC family protein [Proteobacteria bacterium]|nr:TolC family protein [Pseudomonadota bacterium]